MRRPDATALAAAAAGTVVEVFDLARLLGFSHALSDVAVDARQRLSAMMNALTSDEDPHAARA